MKKIVTVLLLYMIIPSVAFADYCDSSDKQRLQKLANNVTYTIQEDYDYMGEENGKFYITFTGVSSELFFVDNLANIHVNYMDYDLGEFSVRNLDGGQTFQIKAYGYYTCEQTLLRTITISLPVLNPYYKDPICDDAKEYGLCEKYNDIKMDYDSFVAKVKEYKSSKISTPNNNNTYEEPRWYQIYRKYYWPSLIGLIIVLGVLIYLWIREQKKNAL